MIRGFIFVFSVAMLVTAGSATAFAVEKPLVFEKPMHFTCSNGFKFTIAMTKDGETAKLTLKGKPPQILKQEMAASYALGNDVYNYVEHKGDVSLSQVKGNALIELGHGCK